MRLAALAAVFVAAVAGTIALCRAMWGMPMPGRGPVLTAAMFLAMWFVMMVAMMLPSLAPLLLRDDSPVIVAMGYFLVWTLAGVIGFALDALVRSVPLVAAAGIVLAGVVQLTPWKQRHLSCCRNFSRTTRPAFEYGLRYGMHCVLCCSGLIAVLIFIGVMNLVVMAFIAAAIALERLAPRPELVARAIGIGIIAVGLVQRT